MPDTPKTSSHTETKEKRVLNEMDAKVENEEKLDGVAKARKSSQKSLHDTIRFDCECDDKACREKISMSTEEFKHVHAKTNSFIVFPGHVQLDIEEVITSFSNYVTVAKLLLPKGNAELI